jgi:hypothetical protein
MELPTSDIERSRWMFELHSPVLRHYGDDEF